MTYSAVCQAKFKWFMIKYNINGITLIVSRLQKFKIGNHYGPNDYIDMQQILRYWNVG